MSRKSKKPLDWMKFDQMKDGVQLSGEWAIDGPMLRVHTRHGTKATHLSSAGFANTLALMLADELATGQ